MEEYKLPAEENEPKILIKKEGTTSDQHGCSPEKRDINDLISLGIINVNKPSGPTSHQVSDYVQKILNIKKSGHSGTLDPKVTGVLPVALADATRIVQTLLPAGKEYITLMRLHEDIKEEKIRKTFKKFTGEIKQLPPVRSAVKRRIRPRKIYYSKILEIKDKHILFVVGCEAGTYIRKLVHDMGRDLGKGAHMVQLVRTKAGPFRQNNWHSLQDLKDAYEEYKETKSEDKLRIIIEPFENAVKLLPKVWIFDSAVSNICHGAPMAVQGISKLTNNIPKDSFVAIMTLKDELVCLGKSLMNSKEIMKNEEGIAIKTEKVFMKRDLYPIQKR
ncbi:RNA-guided pseudouridylation complex pseudouridine synthase subunit Cbf5 [Candidatus Woesearchaeota archaeon]|jgi:H/ACA ribonucleoprotein complex subunit 4|nr:RNA-guided pseudouridylation complex pseudouridine synthase subunit Cbf5 [Candidatus Woesearchaeota archaeon]MBT6044688.1 RNA-guided pseudouridylation complex pseudouridine synthase subunit Cbf5 [Candidatus Woesearchaeota archaeon]